MARQGNVQKTPARSRDRELPVAYTDGACLGNPGPGGWGTRILYPDGMVEEYGGAASTSTTNNRMELQAAIEALNILRHFQSVSVVTDSRYVMDGVTKWIHGWRRRNWRTASNTPVKNRRLWLRLDALNHRGVRWQHVRGHSGDPNNERVDDIARGFAQGAPPVLFKGQIDDASDPARAYVQEIAASVPPRHRQSRQSRVFDKPRYVSIVHGRVALDDEWAACSARVQGVSGALFKKVRNTEELAVFCAKHGVETTVSDFT
jgi:ribonuclease HI